jgi:hypothetical protein
VESLDAVTADGSIITIRTRGAPPVGTTAVEDPLLRLGRLAEDPPDMADLDLNPVLASPNGTVAIDAKLRLAPTGDEPSVTLRRLR